MRDLKSNARVLGFSTLQRVNVARYTRGGIGGFQLCSQKKLDCLVKHVNVTRDNLCDGSVVVKHCKVDDTPSQFSQWGRRTKDLFSLGISQSVCDGCSSNRCDFDVD